MADYPKRLIEVDLPIKRISAHARREKSIRHGHISTLHIWWARRPLASCRAVICAALWPDPADPLCPQAFRDAAAREMKAFAKAVVSNKAVAEITADDWAKWLALSKPENKLDPKDTAHQNALRYLLLDFIAAFAAWEASTEPHFLHTARALTQAAHESLGGAPGTRPLVVDPFAGGGAIPLEALRVGADAFASDLNPVAVLLNKVVLEYIPKYGQRLADEVRKWGKWIKEQAETELAEFYPQDPDGATPIAYLWARTIKCEGPGCGAEVPLIRSVWLAKKANRSVALQLVPRPEAKRVDFQIIVKQRGGWVKQNDPKEKISDPKFDGTVKRGSTTCPCCGYTTPVARVRDQLKARRGGANDARLTCIALTRPGEQGRSYRLPTESDSGPIRRAAAQLERWARANDGPLSLVPDEPISLAGSHRIVKMLIYGARSWGDMLSARQALMMTVYARLVGECSRKCGSEQESLFTTACQTVTALVVSKEADFANSLCRWKPDAECPVQMMARQAIPMLWDFAEIVPISESSGSWSSMVERTAQAIISAILPSSHVGHAMQASATAHALPSDSANAFITDPPYYHAIAYGILSDFFYVWLRRMLASVYPGLLNAPEVPKENEIIVDLPHELNTDQKDIAFYERELTRAFAEGRRILRPDGIGTVVFASKTTASWEAILKAVVEAGWTITGSWPIDTEMATKVAAIGQARLMSSVHLICRPRENPDGSLRTDDVGDWRDVLAELPRRIHDWMPRLAEEGVVGADAIFACLGPALEVFSRHSRVEKASGEAVALGEYLEQVWAAVAREALGLIFAGADATGFEEDARLTAMWLWTLSTGANGSSKPGADEEGEDEGHDEDEGRGGGGKGGRFALEFDAARKIAQGLGAHLEELGTVVEVKGETARLLSVSERAGYLFGHAAAQTPAPRKRKRAKQQGLFAEIEKVEQEEEAALSIEGAPNAGKTSLDRVHQAMLLFDAGRGEALKRFLVEDGVGRDGRFWRLAQALSALYPANSDEKRWVDGVLARKKGLGF